MKHTRKMKTKSILLSKDRKTIVGEVNRLSANSFRWKACGNITMDDYIHDLDLVVFASGKSSSESAGYGEIRKAHAARDAQLQKAIKDNARDAYTKASEQMTSEEHEAEERRLEDLKEADVDA